jgi:hypothetical protein
VVAFLTDNLNRLPAGPRRALSLIIDPVAGSAPCTAPAKSAHPMTAIPRRPPAGATRLLVFAGGIGLVGLLFHDALLEPPFDLLGLTDTP